MYNTMNKCQIFKCDKPLNLIQMWTERTMNIPNLQFIQLYKGKDSNISTCSKPYASEIFKNEYQKIANNLQNKKDNILTLGFMAKTNSIYHLLAIRNKVVIIFNDGCNLDRVIKYINNFASTLPANLIIKLNFKQTNKNNDSISVIENYLSELKAEELRLIKENKTQFIERALILNQETQQNIDKLAHYAKYDLLLDINQPTFNISRETHYQILNVKYQNIFNYVLSTFQSTEFQKLKLADDLKVFSIKNMMENFKYDPIILKSLSMLNNFEFKNDITNILYIDYYLEQMRNIENKLDNFWDNFENNNIAANALRFENEFLPPFRKPNYHVLKGINSDFNSDSDSDSDSDWYIDNKGNSAINAYYLDIIKDKPEEIKLLCPKLLDSNFEQLFNVNPEIIKYIPENHKNNKILDVVIKKNPELIKFFNNISPEKYVEIIKKDPSIIKYIDKKYLTIGAKIIAVSSDYTLLQHIPQTQEICDIACKLNPCAIKYVLPIYQTKDLCLSILHKNIDLHQDIKSNDLQVLLYMYENNKINENTLAMRTDRLDKVILPMLRKNKENVEHINLNVMTDKLMLEEIMTLCPNSIKKLSPSRWTPGIVKAAVSQNGFLIDVVVLSDNPLIDINEMIKIAVKQNGLALQLIPDKYHTSEITFIALKNDILAYPYVKVWSLEACSKIVTILGHEIALEIMETVNNIYHEIFALALVTEQGLYLQDIKNPSYQVCEAAITQNPFSIKYVPSEHQTSKLLIKLGSLSSFSLKHINPDSMDTIQKLIIFSPKYIKYINHVYITVNHYIIALNCINYDKELFAEILDLLISKTSFFYELTESTDFDFNWLMTDKYFHIVRELIKINPQVLKKICIESYSNLSKNIVHEFYAEVFSNEDNYKYCKYMDINYIFDDLSSKIIEKYPNYIKYFRQNYNLVSVAINSDFKTIGSVNPEYLDKNNVIDAASEYLDQFGGRVIREGEYQVFIKDYKTGIMKHIGVEEPVNNIFLTLYRELRETHAINTSTADILDKIYKNQKNNMITVLKAGNSNSFIQIKKNGENYLISMLNNNFITKMFKVMKVKVEF
jgi:hypothetical protein